MSEHEELEKELSEYFEKELNMSRADRREYLMAIFQKHMEFKKFNHVVNYKDWFNILAQAKNIYTKLTLPVRISHKQLEPNDTIHIAMLESFMLYLGKNDLLNRTVQFDFTEKSE